MWPYYIAFGVVAFALILGYSFAGVLGVMAVLVPLLMLRFSHLQYINRTKEMVSAMFVFSLLVILIFNFAFDLRAENLNTVAPGVLWVAIIFAGMLGLSRSFILERDQGVLDGLLLAPIDRSAIYFGKMIGNVLFISVVEIVVLPIFMILFNQPANILPMLVGVVILGTIGFASVGRFSRRWPFIPGPGRCCCRLCSFRSWCR